MPPQEATSKIQKKSRFCFSLYYLMTTIVTITKKEKKDRKKNMLLNTQQKKGEHTKLQKSVEASETDKGKKDQEDGARRGKKRDTQIVKTNMG